jgi:hypothetical protein
MPFIVVYKSSRIKNVADNNPVHVVLTNAKLTFNPTVNGRKMEEVLTFFGRPQV